MVVHLGSASLSPCWSVVPSCYRVVIPISALKGTRSLSEPRANSLLGYPDDARLLMINADDFGMCHSNNEAILEALLNGVVTSTTLMMPCPWSRYAIDILKAHPEIPFGVHLTLVSEFDGFRWGPLSSKNR